MSDLKQTLDFLRDLNANNNKPWFEANRGRYDRARSAFEDLIQTLIERFESVDDLGGVTVKECLYRINRDIRFSKDKTPYKTQMGALLARGGRKSTGRWYYVHVQPGGESFLAGGLYQPTTEQLRRMRETIADDDRPLRAILAAPEFVRYFDTLEGEALKTAPAGYAKDHHAIDLLRFKQFTASHHLSDAQVTGDDLPETILTVFRAMKPFVVYVNDAAGEAQWR